MGENPRDGENGCNSWRWVRELLILAKVGIFVRRAQGQSRSREADGTSKDGEAGKKRRRGKGLGEGGGVDLKQGPHFPRKSSVQRSKVFLQEEESKAPWPEEKRPRRKGKRKQN